MMNYREDSTRGKSVLNPRTYKRDVLMQVWMQSRHLATLLRYLESNGVFVRFRSEIVQTIIEQVVGHLVDNGEVEMVEFADDARRTLESRFGAANNPGGRGGKNAMHNMTLDERIRERAVGGATADYNIGKKRQTKTEDRYGISPELLAEGERILKEITKKQQDEDIERQKERIKGMAGEDGIVTPIGIPSGVVTEKDMEKSKVEQDERDRIAAVEKERDKEFRKTERRRETLERQIEERKKELDDLHDESDAPLKRSDEEIVADRERKDEELAKQLDEMP